MRIPERLIPANIWQLFQHGVIDVGALLCYAAALLVIALIIWWLRKRSMASRYALTGVLVALSLVLLFSDWADRVPPVYADLSKEQLITPSPEFVDRLNEACAGDQLITSLDAPTNERDALLDAFLRRLQGRLGIPYQYANDQFDPGGAVNTIFVRSGRGITAVAYEHSIVTNPASPEGATKQWLNVENELLQGASLIKAAKPVICRMAGPEDEARPTMLMDAVRVITADALTPLDLDQPVPEDCTFILMDNPQQDLTEQQASLLRSYLGRGGRLLLITDYVYGAMPNLNNALEEYGLQAIDGVVFDPSAAMGGRPEYPMPRVTGDHVIGRWLQSAGREPLMPLSHGIVVRQIEGVDGVALLTTTEDAYCQLNGVEHASLDRGDEDPQGPFCLAAAAQMGNGKVVWVASSDMMTEAADGDVGGANEELLLASMRWLMDAQVEPLAAKPLQ